ncbi:MAG: VanZ family protein [Candidatus Omnitrophica bacterium]|nr:VanZ family protein [Candidatus Omnitrophota bacterium]
MRKLPIPNLDKIIHFVLYFPLPGLFFLHYRVAWAQRPVSFFFKMAVILSLIYAASDEWHQSFVPGRNMDFFDFLADAVGIFSGAYLFCRFSKSKDAS